MKRLVVLLACAGASLCGADLSAVRNVYVMPMARGFDQYLANRIASQGPFVVVADPKLADAVFSDRLGQAFETQLENLFPTPKPPEEIEAEKAAKEEDKDKEKDTSIAEALRETAGKLESPAQNSSFGRTRGNIFLVEAKTRVVLWSTYDPPKTTEARELDRTASHVVTQLKKDMAPKKQK